MASSNNKRLGTLLGFLAGISVGLSACSHSAKKSSTPILSELQGKKVALVEISGEASARPIIEVALVNQLIQRGTFELVSKQEVEIARSAPEQGPLDGEGIARRAGADYALRAFVLQFEAKEYSGHSSSEVEDSQLAAERGESERKTQRMYPVRSLEGVVRIQLEFTPLAHLSSADWTPSAQSAIAEAEERQVVEGKDEAIHLPPKQRFLEKLTNQAFRKFFDQYN